MPSTSEHSIPKSKCLNEDGKRQNLQYLLYGSTV